MIWRSVVGKLWGTILLLVTVVLAILLFLMLRSFETFHKNEAESHLLSYANTVAIIYETYENKALARSTISTIADDHHSSVVILDNDRYWHFGKEIVPAEQLVEKLLEDKKLSKVFFQEEPVINQIQFEKDEKVTEMMVVGRTLHLDNNDEGAIFLYQSLSSIEQAAAETKKIIYFSAVIALVLTTVFAFFLSSRVASPLRKMKQAAVEVTEGKFDTKVPILTNDEIGQLAMVFNRMRQELKKNLMELNQEKEQLSRILSSMADGVITLDRKGAIVLTNPPAERFLTAWYYEQGLDSNSYDSLPDEMKKLFQRVVAIEKEQAAEIDIQGRNWAVSMSPLYDDSFVRGAVAVIRDVTEERRLEKLREDFIANVSHELRTPIAMLQGYSEAIIDDIASSDEEKKELAQIIYDESLRMGRLVNELLDLARMESGKMELHKKKVNLKDFAERVIRKFQGLSKEHKIELSLKLHLEDPWLEIDVDRIEQVLTNLIHNALRYTNEGGSVTLVITSTINSVKFDIIDTGTGIPEEDLPYVFERFYKADKARTRGRSSGTGLGLAIAKNIVEAHGGHIGVHSKKGEGSTFTFTIPKNI